MGKKKEIDEDWGDPCSECEEEHCPEWCDASPMNKDEH